MNLTKERRNKMYKNDMGDKIKLIRKYICGYSQRKLARLVGEDIETIRMLENGEIKNPPPQLILRIAEELDSFYMEFVKKEYEQEFLYYLDWGTNDDDKINFYKNMTLSLSDIILKLKLNKFIQGRKKD